MAYLTPEQINAALDFAHIELTQVLKRLHCTHSKQPLAVGPRLNIWTVYTSDVVLAFTGTAGEIGDWLRNSNPSCSFAELSPMRRDRLVAAFVSPGRDLLGGIRKFRAQHSGAAFGAVWSDSELNTMLVGEIWSLYATHAGWSYLECLESPASVAREALDQWSSQHDDGWNDDRGDDPGAYDAF